MKKSNIKKMGYHTLAISGTSVLLVIVLVILTVQNYNREDNLIKKQLFNEGSTIISILESSIQNGMRKAHWEPELIKTLFTEANKASDIEYIMLVDSTGKIITNSQLQGFGESVPILPENVGSTTFDIYENAEGKEIFNVFKFLSQIPSTNINTDIDRPGNFGYDNNWNKYVAGKYIVIGLKMESLKDAQEEDVRRSIISAVILLVLATASLFFLFIVQNYYLTHNTLQSLESYTANVVNSIPNGLISLDSEGRITTMNQIGANLLGLVFSKVKGRRLDEVMKECKLEKALLPTSDIHEQQMDCYLNDGRVIPMSITSSLLKDENDKAIGKVIVLRDLRDIKSLEKKIERSERLAGLGRMAAGIAHEIRNPLSSIKGFAQYFQMKFGQDSEDSNYARVMVNEVDRLNRVIQDLLNFAKPQEAKFQAVNLVDIIEHTLKLMESDFREKNIELVKGFDNDLPEILADSDMITQALLNIFINANEAMEKDGKLIVKVVKVDDGVNVFVEDTGKGISKDNIRKIFDPFFTAKSGGTGLGLAIVHRIVENHHGEIEVKSEDGKGTTFRIYLPLKQN